jgi:hypothetical protein
MRSLSALSILGLGVALTACGGASQTLDLGNGTNLCGLTCPVTDIAPGTDSRGNPTENTGNNTSLTADTGDTTLVLEKSTIVNLDDGTPALSKLKITGKTASYQIDPNTPDQADWPKSKEYDYYKTPSDALGGTGKYKEYHLLSRSTTGIAIDEELQVWNWKHSYGVQYRHLQGGDGEAAHQAWSFGGTRTAALAVPTTGSATYNGRFGSTAKSSNWDDTPIAGQTIAKNNKWRVNGKSETTVNFATGSVKSTLTPQKWNAYRTLGGQTGFKDVVVDLKSAEFNKLSALDQAENKANRFNFMDDVIKLNGTLTKTTTANKIAGSATLVAAGGNSQPVNGKNTNLFRGALFGTAADEFTGIFNLEATYPSPTGGTIPINDDRRAFLNHSGVVNGFK